MPPRQPHSHQPPNPPRSILYRTRRHMLPWTLRGLALAALGYVLAVAVLGAMPRPTNGQPLPACCPATGRHALPRNNGMAGPCRMHRVALPRRTAKTRAWRTPQCTKPRW